VRSARVLSAKKMYSQATPGVYGRYQQQYPQQPPAHYPPQPPVYTVDPNTFRRDYMGSLSELTFNSRPIIQNLSNIAADNHRYADIVVSCIDDHIRRVSPSS
jgi:pre-mRNA cleavage complex 2 protein Pcf11